MEQQEKVTDRDRERYYRELVPFGYMDVDAAIKTAIEAGKGVEWAAEQVTRYVDECDTKLEDMDPVDVVYEGILQEARNEIEEAVGYDLCNDVTARTGIYTAGNYCCTSYDYSEEAVDELAGKLADVELEDLSEATQWFFTEIGIDQERIDKNKPKPVKKKK